MRSLRCISSPDRRAALAALGTLATLAAPARPAEAQRGRPAVTLDVRIDGKAYRQAMNDEPCRTTCAAVRAALVDSVRAAFDRAFGFLEWRAGAAPDTLRVSWTNAATQAGELELVLFGKHHVAGERPTRVAFESFFEISERPASVWQRPLAVRDLWLARLRGRLRLPANALAITSGVLAEVPFDSVVKLGQPPDVIVALSPRALRANPTRNPAFLLRMRVVDPANVPPSAARQDNVEAALTACSRAADGRGYICRIERIDYSERTPPVTVETAEIVALARRAKQEPGTLHVWRYFPADGTDDAPIRNPED